MEKIKVLVTGATGMVGRNLLDHPDIRGYIIGEPNHKVVDLLSYNEVKQYLVQNKPDIIIHAAGKVGGIMANAGHNLEFYVDNLNMGKNLVLAAHEVGIRKFINLGSSCMYPRDQILPLKENQILTGQLEPTNEGYALAKCSITKLCQYISESDISFQYKTLVPCNLYGRYDKFDSNRAHLIPSVIRKLEEAKLNHQKDVEIWGDGKARREFMYSGDLADCIIHAIKNFDKLPAVMNVGVGIDYTVREYYEKIADVVGYDGTFTYDLTKPAGMKRKLVDITLEKQFGWQPKTSLEDGLKITYEYYKSQCFTGGKNK